MSCEAVIGLEVHVQLSTRTKMFCSCPTVFETGSNTQTCPVCLGFPGALPVVNRHAVECALLISCAAGCRIPPVSSFARKHYFYPDLPKGYQITQYEQPLAVDGSLEIDDSMGGKKNIRITRIHLEEDAGRLLHAREVRPSTATCIDYNRAGVPLVEIVSAPCMHTAHEAGAYLRSLHSLVQYLGVCDGIMEQGSFRFDANVSIRPNKAAPLGTKVELKNLNSFRHVQSAIEYEIGRQMDIVTGGNSIAHETRSWNEKRCETVAMRSKEDACDYRYLIEPDLPPLVIDNELTEQTIAQLPELPRARKKRFIDRYALTEYDAECLTRLPQPADYFEECVAMGADPKQVCNWIMGDIARMCDDLQTITGCTVTPAHLAALISSVQSGEINLNVAKVVFEEMIVTSEFPDVIIERNSLYQVSDSEALHEVISTVLERYPDEVLDYRGGKNKLYGFFVGQVMRATGGKADPVLVTTMLRRMLDE